MAKSRIGPFALEAPLAPPNGTSQMFRGIHVEQRKLAALRIFPIPLGMTPESRQAFASQLEKLKQLRHPGIVRCYGGGFDTRKAFLAYELVDGESLDKVLQRRGRLPWETALDYGRQLGEALEYAQQFKWSHGRLQPSKILVTSDGLLKIADWRRDDISAILNAPATVEQLRMTAPELLDGQPANEKSDLYSLGGILFTIITGQPPFPATDSAALVEQIRNQPIPSVASQVLDCPIWLSAVVDQLLAKSPQQRPYGTAAMLSALRVAQQRQSEGVGVLQHAAAGFSPLRLNIDRQEAEKVLGIKPEKEPAQPGSSPWESPWLLAAGLLLALGLVVWFLLPPGESQLQRRAETLLASEDWIDWNTARDSYLRPLLERFPDGQYREWADEKVSWVNAREAERRLDRDERLGRREQWNQAQSQYAEARGFERFGDFVSALEKYQAIRTLFADQAEAQPIVYLAAEGIQRINQLGNQDSLQTLLNKKMSQASQAYERAQISAAKQIWEAIVELYAGNQQVVSIVEQAQARLQELNVRN